MLLIVVDTLRADHLSCYGYSRETSPHIDSLAGESVVFRNAVSSSPWTTPSVACLFTSQYPAVLGYRVHPIKLDETFLTMAEIFKENGYATGGIISNIFVSAGLGFDQGFDTYEEVPSWKVEGISSHLITDKAIDFLKYNEGKKFFLYLHYNDPHYNYRMHENYNYYPGYAGPLYSGQKIRALREALPSLNKEDIKYLNALYDSEISFTDEHIGRLLQILRDMDLYENTLIVLTADHGEEFAEREDPWIGHTTKVFQEMIHVPLMVKLEKEIVSNRVEEEVGIIDLLPTLVHHLKLKAPKAFEGERIDLQKGIRHKKTYFVCETLRECSKHAVIFNGWKFIIDSEKNKKELFNLLEDPLELNSQLRDRRELAREFEKMLYEWADLTSKKREGLKLVSKAADFTEEQIKILRSLSYIK